MFSVIVDLDWFGDLHVKFWLILIENRRKQTKPTEVAKLTHVLASEAAQMVVELLRIGKDCYLGTVQVILSRYEYRNIASKTIPKSKQTWNDCVRLTEN